MWMLLVRVYIVVNLIHQSLLQLVGGKWHLKCSMFPCDASTSHIVYVSVASISSLHDLLSSTENFNATDWWVDESLWNFICSPLKSRFALQYGCYKRQECELSVDLSSRFSHSVFVLLTVCITIFRKSRRWETKKSICRRRRRGRDSHTVRLRHLVCF